MKQEIQSSQTKFGIKFKDGYKVEMDVDNNHQLWPVSVYVESDNWGNQYFIWDGESHNQLYGQMMTLLEAVIENPERLKAVKTLMKREINRFEEYITQKANLLTDGENCSNPKNVDVE